MPTLTGTPMMIPMTELMTVPYRTPIAPNLVLPSKATWKMSLKPPANQVVDCCAVVYSDEDEDDKDQQAGGEGQDLETPVAERPAAVERAGGPGRAGRVRLRHRAHDGSLVRAV